MSALERVGRELDAADRLREYDPWLEITRQEELIRRLAQQLSVDLWSEHPELAQRLAGAAALHLHWGELQDQLRRMASPWSSPSTDISS